MPHAPVALADALVLAKRVLRGVATSAGLRATFGADGRSLRDCKGQRAWVIGLMVDGDERAVPRSSIGLQATLAMSSIMARNDSTVSAVGNRLSEVGEAATRMLILSIHFSLAEWQKFSYVVRVIVAPTFERCQW